MLLLSWVFFAIWFARNDLRFNNHKPNVRRSILYILFMLNDIGKVTSGHMNNSQSDLLLLRYLGIPAIPTKAPSIIEVRWYPPPVLQLLVGFSELVEGLLKECSLLILVFTVRFMLSWW